MVKVGREQVIAIGAAFLVVATCFLVMGFSIQAYFDALQELSAEQETLARLESQSRPRNDAKGRPVAALAPAAAFLTSPTPGLGSAQLQSYISRLAGSYQAVLVSTSVEAARNDSLDSIRIQVTMDVPVKQLQSMLFQIEGGTPYVFVELMTIMPPQGAVVPGIQDTRLRVTLGLRALWRRDAA